MAILKQSASFAWSKNLAPNILHIALKPDQDFKYLPGQFITLHFTKDGHEIKRSYSIANPPNSSEYIEFAISYQKHGVASEQLFNNLKPGDQLPISGPAGRLVLLDEQPQRYVLVATGTGVTPYRAMLDQIKLLIENSNTKFLLLFGVRNFTECLYYEDFNNFAKQNRNFQFEIFYSREMPSQNIIDLSHNTAGHHQGYVQTGFSHYDLDPASDMVYLCGNPNMIDIAYPLLTEYGFTARNVRREKYISSK